MDNKKASIAGAVAMVLIILALTTAFVAGKKTGRDDGVQDTAEDFRFWAQSIMFPDQQVRAHAYQLVRDGEVIRKPTCASPDTPYLRLSRLPDEDKTMAKIDSSPDGLTWIARIPQGIAKKEPLAAAIIGCFVDGEKEPWTKKAGT